MMMMIFGEFFGIFWLLFFKTKRICDRIFFLENIFDKMAKICHKHKSRHKIIGFIITITHYKVYFAYLFLNLEILKFLIRKTA
jgi:hypothetical protein